MKFYVKIDGLKFPRYVGGEGYAEVETTEETYDFNTQLPGNWSTPILKDGKWKSTRGVIDKTQELIDAEAADDLKNLISRRNAYIAETDRMLTEDYPISASDRTALLVYRKELRDITDKTNEGGIKDPKKIKLEKFKP